MTQMEIRKTFDTNKKWSLSVLTCMFKVEFDNFFAAQNRFWVLIASTVTGQPAIQ